MSGPRKRDRRDGAQLALVDAMVFFAIALVISTLFLGSAGRVSDPEPSEPLPYVESLLRSFLGASLCERLILSAGGGIEIGPYEKVCDCLAVELHMLREGCPLEAFAPLDSLLALLLDSVIPEPYWFILESYDPSLPSRPLMQLERNWGPSDQVYASSAPIPDGEGEALLVVLQLGLPAPLLEVP